MSSTSRQQLANAIRVLSADAVQQANSGHPGAPMGMADIAEVLWNDFLRHNPSNPNWMNRDRFVLSNGHGSMLIYSLLHLTGYDVSADDIRNFRQLHSKTPGHPEYGYTPGVETTTGPLGQGIANAIGMAMAERTLAAQFNSDEQTIIDHFTYVFLGDGCLMEGISHEACSLAGNQGLGKLVAFWDDNGISIDGDVEGWFSDNTPERFQAYGWQVISGVDGHNRNQIRQAIEEARAETGKPTLICCKTVIGKGSPNKEGSENCHGSPLGADEIALVRQQLDWDSAPFMVPTEVADAWDATIVGAQRESEWQQQYDAWSLANPAMAKQLQRRLSGELTEDWSTQTANIIAAAQAAGENLATRKASLKALNAFGPLMPELIGGSADLAGSNYTIWDQSNAVSAAQPKGNYVYYGVREFAMAAISNGIALHGGFKAYTGTFLVFSDYMRNGLRMSALMGLPVIHVLTHDSIGLGEDGPTHQAVEHTASLRLIPNMSVWRPCDVVESLVAWRVACEQTNTPSCLIFSRQTLPHQERTAEQLAAVEKGGYTLIDCEGNPDILLIATGSEVALAVDAAARLSTTGHAVRVVSMPSTDRFDAQDESYRESVLPAAVSARLAIEAGSTDYWYKYVGLHGQVIGMQGYGESAPAEQLFEHFGFSVENVVASAENLLKK